LGGMDPSLVKRDWVGDVNWRMSADICLRECKVDERVDAFHGTSNDMGRQP
jgi:hypothetical protein